MTVTDELRHQVLALPVEERASLARELILSLETTPPDEDAAQAWKEEAEKRADAYARGELAEGPKKSARRV